MTGPQLSSADEILTAAEVSQITKVPLGTLKYWRHDRQGPRSFTLGERVVRYRRSDVDAWLAERYTTTDRRVTS